MKICEDVLRALIRDWEAEAKSKDAQTSKKSEIIAVTLRFCIAQLESVIELEVDKAWLHVGDDFPEPPPLVDADAVNREKPSVRTLPHKEE